MQVTIDRAGRIVVPRPLRQELGLGPDSVLELEVVDGHLELSAIYQPPALIDGPNGPVVAPAGAALTAAEVRQALEATRERR